MIVGKGFYKVELILHADTKPRTCVKDLRVTLMLKFRKFQVHSSFTFWVITKNFFHLFKIHWPMNGQKMTSSNRITVKTLGNAKQVNILALTKN